MTLAPCYYNIITSQNNTANIVVPSLQSVAATTNEIVHGAKLACVTEGAVTAACIVPLCASCTAQVLAPVEG